MVRSLNHLPPQTVTTKRELDGQVTQQISNFIFDRMGVDFRIGKGMGHAAVVIEVAVDTWLGKVRVLRVWQNLAIGRTYLPDMARSQVYGGVIQGMGYALYEEKVFDPGTGNNLTTNLQDYRIPGIGDTRSRALSMWPNIIVDVVEIPILCAVLITSTQSLTLILPGEIISRIL